MKRDIICLSSIISIFVVILIVAYTTPSLVEHTQCTINLAALHDLPPENGQKSTYLVAEVTILRDKNLIDNSPLNELVILMTPPLLEGNPLWTPNIPFNEYKSGSSFACDVHTWRPRAYQTVAEFDGVPNIATNVNQRDLSYDGVISWAKTFSYVVGGAYVVILVNVLSKEPIISGLNMLYRKLEDGDILGSQQTTTI
jgi:hypothetical protein